MLGPKPWSLSTFQPWLRPCLTQDNIRTYGYTSSFSYSASACIFRLKTLRNFSLLYSHILPLSICNLMLGAGAVTDSGQMSPPIKFNWLKKPKLSQIETHNCITLNGSTNCSEYSLYKQYIKTTKPTGTFEYQLKGSVCNVISNCKSLTS